MGLNIIDRIQAKIELFRLEQRYTRRRHRRSTFVSNAVYVDGEYIYNSPNTTGSSTTTHRTQTHAPDLPASPSDTDVEASSPTSPSASKAQKRLNRWSSMPGFGAGAAPSSPQPEQQQDYRSKRMSYAGGAR
ncbi:hypothetical protein OQA88_8646 [Cercophora sp. LCS_1]